MHFLEDEHCPLLCLSSLVNPSPEFWISFCIFQFYNFFNAVQFSGFFFFFKTLCGIYSILIACESISYFLFCVSLLVWVSWSYFLACLAIFYELWRQSCKGWGCCLWQAGGRCKEYLDPAESRLLTLLGQVCPSPHTPGAVLVESPGGLLGPLCLARPWMSSLSLALQSPERSLLKSRHPTAVFCLGSADLVLPTRGLRACECIEGKFHEEFWPRFLAAPSSSQTELSSWFPAALAAPRPTSIPQLSPKPGSAFSFLSVFGGTSIPAPGMRRCPRMPQGMPWGTDCLSSESTCSLISPNHFVCLFVFGLNVGISYPALRVDLKWEFSS